MSKKRVYATCDIGEPAFHRLRELGYDLEVYPDSEPPPKSLIIEKVKSGIDGLITYRKSADSTRTNWPAVASAFQEALTRVATPQQLSDLFGTTDLSDVVSIHSATVPGPRVLRLLKESRNE